MILISLKLMLALMSHQNSKLVQSVWFTPGSESESVPHLSQASQGHSGHLMSTQLKKSIKSGTKVNSLISYFKILMTSLNETRVIFAFI